MRNNRQFIYVGLFISKIEEEKKILVNLNNKLIESNHWVNKEKVIYSNVKSI